MLFSIAILISPVGFRAPFQIHRIVREKARVQGAMASIVEWQSLKMQEYRCDLLMAVSRIAAKFGIAFIPRCEKPVEAGDYDHALHVDYPEAPSLLEAYLPIPTPQVPTKTRPLNEPSGIAAGK